MTMEIIDFNPHVVQRRLAVGAEVEKVTVSGSPPAPGRGETLAKDRNNKETVGSADDLGDRKADLEAKPGGTLDPKRGELESRSWIVTVPPSQVPPWIPVGAATRCNLPYTSYEIPIPLDLNMGFCIDVMMGQDTIVFMFVCGGCFVPVSGRG